jgi:hypothetical protein
MNALKGQDVKAQAEGLGQVGVETCQPCKGEIPVLNAALKLMSPFQGLIVH